MYDRFFRSLYRIRRVEEEVARIYPTDKIKSPVHLSIGQEAVAVGVCEALRSDDIAFGTYRGHAIYLAKGGNLKKMVAELYGKATGCAKGKGGSMHLVDAEAGVMGASAVVGTTIPQAVGYAYALKLQKKDSLVVNFFGDGAADEGAFHESLNFAALKRVPLIFICENNLYSIHSHQRTRHPVEDICLRARAYGIPAERIENNDVLKIFESVSKAAVEVRAGDCGPKFFECMTYRWKEHVGPNDDYHAGYRTLEEAQPWFDQDQVRRLGEMLDPALREKIENEVEEEIREAFEYAEQSPFPAAEELYTDMYA
jgi:TPP-dependent pyruvate/acetoin dehydrogenase alpha subunit